jgi:hypothetical protein
LGTSGRTDDANRSGVASSPRVYFGGKLGLIRIFFQQRTDSFVEIDAALAQSPQRPRLGRDSTRWLIAILVAAAAVRSIGITQPLVGNFATKHCVYAMAARNWALDRAPWWRPTLDCIAGDERAWHLMEWPVPAYVAGMLWRTCGGSLDVWGRAVGITASLVSVALVYLLARRHFGETAARAASAVLAFSPLAVVHGRGFLIEPTLMALSLAAVYAFERWWQDAWKPGAIIAAACFAIAVLCKIYMLLLVVPLAFEMFRSRVSLGKYVVTGVAFAAAFAPAAWWYAKVAGISPVVGPAAEYHPFSRAAVHGIPHPLLFTADYYLALVRDLATVTLTPIGLALLAIGLCDARCRRCGPWLAASGALVVLLPLKFFHANYYELVLLPPLALAVGVGWQRFVERYRPRPRTIAAIAAVSLFVAARYSAGPIVRVYDEDRGVVAAAEAVQSSTLPSERIATLHGATLDLLYYCDRTGWALDVGDAQLLEKLADAESSGATRLVIACEARAAESAALTAWRSTRTPESQGDDWAVYRLDGSSFAPAAASPAPATSARSAIATTAESPRPPAPRNVAR